MDNEDALKLIRDCWNSFGEHSAPMLTTVEQSEVDDLLRLLESLIGEA